MSPDYALTNLININVLYLDINNISDITALVQNCDSGGLGTDDLMDLRTNPLGASAINTDILYLRSKGVVVDLLIGISIFSRQLAAFASFL